MDSKTDRLSDLAARIETVREQIEGAARRSGRDPSAITLVAVTKTVDADRLREAVNLGVTHLGENHVQEAREKIDVLKGHLPSSVEWHLIGHLQSNKARLAVDLFSMIESVDTLRLAEHLDHVAREKRCKVPVLLEVNVGNEESKFGFHPSELAEVMPRLLALPFLDIRGLMTVAPVVSDPQLARPFFRQLRELQNDLSRQFGAARLTELSMGMTNDYPVAIEEGATIVRVGRAIFGDRPIVEQDRVNGDANSTNIC